MSMNINMEVYCDGCGAEGFHGSFYSKKEVYDELRTEGWKIKKNKENWITQPWIFFCPTCADNNNSETEK